MAKTHSPVFVFSKEHRKLVWQQCGVMCFSGAWSTGCAPFLLTRKSRQKERVRMDYKKELLLKSAARLYSLGFDLEAAKEQIHKLVADGVGYDTAEMAKAVREYTEIKELWDNLEKEHLALLNEIDEEI